MSRQGWRSVSDTHTDTQSPRQFSPHLSPWQPSLTPFHLKLAEAVVSARRLNHFTNGVQIVVDWSCQKVPQTQQLLNIPLQNLTKPFFSINIY